MNKYTVEIIGCGNKGALADAPGSGNEHKYLSYANAVRDHDGFELSRFADKLGGFDELSRAEELWGVGTLERYPDVVVIATPDDKHYGHLMRIIDQESCYLPKLVICEKPLCEKVSEAEDIVKLYHREKVPLLVDYTRRFIPYWQEMFELRKKQAGQFLHGYCVFNRGWMHTASHFVDTALWFNMFPRFGMGTTARLQLTEVAPDYQWVYQWGLFFERDFFSEHSANREHGEQPNPIYDNHTKYVMENAYNFLEGKEHLRCTGMDALLALKATHAIMERGKG